MPTACNPAEYQVDECGIHSHSDLNNMTTKQQNKLAMYLAVKAVLDANNAVWQTLQAFADGYTGFNTQIGLIQTLAQGQNMDTSGIAQDKKASKFAMAQAAVGIASAVRAFAVKSKNNTLAGEVDFNQSDITSARDEILENCQNIHAPGQHQHCQPRHFWRDGGPVDRAANGHHRVQRADGQTPADHRHRQDGDAAVERCV